MREPLRGEKTALIRKFHTEHPEMRSADIANLVRQEAKAIGINLVITSSEVSQYRFHLQQKEKKKQRQEDGLTAKELIFLKEKFKKIGTVKILAVLDLLSVYTAKEIKEVMDFWGMMPQKEAA